MEAETFVSILQSDVPPLLVLLFGAMFFYYMLTRKQSTCAPPPKEEDAKVDVKPPINIGITHVVIRPTNGAIHAQREVAEDR
jgi:hypothetical protein